jgi:hypothetical protein
VRPEEPKYTTADHLMVESHNGRRQKGLGQEHQYMAGFVVHQRMVELVVRHSQSHDLPLQQRQGQSHQRHQVEEGSFRDEQLALEQAVQQDCTPWVQSWLVVLQSAPNPTCLYSRTPRGVPASVAAAHDQMLVGGSVTVGSVSFSFSH